MNVYVIERIEVRHDQVKGVVAIAESYEEAIELIDIWSKKNNPDFGCILFSEENEEGNLELLKVIPIKDGWTEKGVIFDSFLHG